MDNVYDFDKILLEMMEAAAIRGSCLKLFIVIYRIEHKWLKYPTDTAALN